MSEPRFTPASALTALRKGAYATAVSLVLIASPGFAGDELPPGYAMETPEGGLHLSFGGETVFETAPPELLIAANITGPHDMTGDGILNLVIYERIGRSAASLTVFSLAPEGPEVLMQTTGMAANMRPFESITVDTDLSALLGLPTRPRPEPGGKPETPPEPEAEAMPEVTGHWLTLGGSWEEGFAAKMGWVVPEYSETEYATMLFRCPDNGDPYWVEPLIFHDTHDEIPRRVLLDLDGTLVALPVAPQMDDPRSDQWYAIGTLPRDSTLFSQMAAARSIVLHYGDYPPFNMAGGAAAPEQREQIMRFSALCAM